MNLKTKQVKLSTEQLVMALNVGYETKNVVVVGLRPEIKLGAKTVYWLEYIDKPKHRK